MDRRYGEEEKPNMLNRNWPKPISRPALVAASAVVTISALQWNVFAAPTTATWEPAPTNSASTNIAPANPEGGLTGAELYSIHCNRCHAERYPTERTAASWKTVNLHMQIRANIPPSQARLILKYLQDNSGR